jgi:hypothetical protein
LIEELTYGIDALVLIRSPASRTYMFGWVIVSRQLHFHIYYLFVVCDVLFGLTFEMYFAIKIIIILYLTLQVGIDNVGKIQYLNATIVEDEGCSNNENILSFTVSGFPNCYSADNFSLKTAAVLTNLPSNSFARAPGLWIYFTDKSHLNTTEIPTRYLKRGYNAKLPFAKWIFSIHRCVL